MSAAAPAASAATPAAVHNAALRRRMPRTYAGAPTDAIRNGFD
jgi:hypothetical protein